MDVQPSAIEGEPVIPQIRSSDAFYEDVYEALNAQQGVAVAAQTGHGWAAWQRLTGDGNRPSSCALVARTPLKREYDPRLGVTK